MRKQSLTLAALCAATVLGLTAPTAVAAAAPAAAGTPAPADSADFNGDGYPDVATSAPTTTVSGLARAGAVAVQYGSPTGLQKPVLITKNTPGVPGLPADGGRFGILHGQGDVDGDGYVDLLVEGGADAEHRSTGIMILRGSKDGITGRYTSQLHSGAYAVGGPSVHVTDPHIGDVTGDGIADIVTPSYNTDGKSGLAILQGPLSPATNEPARILFRDTETLDNSPARNLHLGDMTGDGIADIVLGPYGTGTLLKGTPGGLVKGGSLVGYGAGGSFGDLNKDGYQDFVSGDGGTWNTADGGRIAVTYGGPDGVSTTIPARVYTQDTAGVPGVSEVGDRFGASVSVGDTDQDGYADIVIGASYETGSDTAATWSGSVTVLRGSATGVTTTGAKVLTQDSPGVPSTSEKDDHFGSAVSVIDTDKDGKAEVYVGGYGEDNYAGRVWKLKTDATGITGTGATAYNFADLGGAAGRAHFGFAFGSGGSYLDLRT
ncbi:FG-GAP and VCBS repeat-containing protein [Streptomyces sp. AP-93]|uniref:FG-GAP and VCBS repeat-containing protein n=1 Tax=Streptomyces sp. AP-93 TaxID=2929048 RepID=UPI001FAEDE53|nr:FG-GAP and VCBS repeat-containing protein [Streptomyces sp. AP-93]MCJ0873617.1 FG-GAP and VCBS repeat-containing protein [Streptomyces sp. AP-93]